MSNEMTPQQFVAKWAKSTLKESTAYQEHFLDRCHILGQPTPAKVDPGGSFYTFQKGVVYDMRETEEETLFGPIPAGRDRQDFADVWYHEHFAWEYKDKPKSPDKAYEQLLQYREDIQNPPLLVLCDFDRFIIHTTFNNRDKKRIEFSTADLDKPENLTVLRALFENPQSLRPRPGTPLTPRS